MAEVTPKEIRCKWRPMKHGDIRVEAGWDYRGCYFCPDCKMWTANLLPELYEVCPKKDRRKGAKDRRRTPNER